MATPVALCRSVDTGSMIRQLIHYSGRVQGVGFRYTTCQIAVGYSVTGYVKNMPDGRVEVIVEGSSKEVQRFVAAVASEMSLYIHDTRISEYPATGEFDRFDVRF